MSNVFTYRPLCRVNIWQAYYLHPVEIAAADLVDPVGRPNALKTAKQEEISANPAAIRPYSAWADLDISPTGPTRQLMQSAKWVFRAEDSGFSLWARARQTSPGIFFPFIPADAPFKLTFIMRVKNPAFFVFTNIDTAPGTIYYFSNRANNRFSNTNYLNATPAQLTPPFNYASAADRFPIRGPSLTVDVSAQQSDYVRFVWLGEMNTAESVFEKAPDESILNICQLVPQNLPSGMYTLSAFNRNGNEMPALKQVYYHNSGDIPPDTFAIIDIAHLPGAPASPYTMLAADQRLLAPEYTLWWQNRSTLWRYCFDRDQPAPDEANAACNVRYETPALKNRLLSKTKLPLLNRYRKMCFRKSNSNEEILLPNPAADRIYPEGSELYSEIYLTKTDLNKIIPGTS